MVKNVHERVFWASRGEVGDLIDGLGSEDDGLWPRDGWPPLRLDRPLGVGAAGGHGPIRYRVEEYEPGRSVRFRFVGSEGTHGLELTEVGPGTVRLRHELVLKPRGFERLSWALLTRPLHDALVEDLLDRAEAHTSGGSAEPRAWSWRVRMLRRILGRSGRAAAALREENATAGHGEPEDAGNVGALLDEIMPEYEFNEVHRVRVAAPPERALDALKRVTPGEMPLVLALFAVRSLPAILTGKRGLPTERTKPLYEQVLGFGFTPLGEEPSKEVVCGVIGQPWRLVGGSAPPIRDAREFAAFREEGYAKAAMSFSVEPTGGRTELRTETRVLPTDPVARRRFARYWRVIYPGSAAIRRSWLRATKSRAERESGSGV